MYDFKSTPATGIPHPPEVETQAHFVIALESVYLPDVVEAARRVIERNDAYRDRTRITWDAETRAAFPDEHWLEESPSIDAYPTAAQVMEQAG